MALEQITFNIGAFNDANAGGNNYYQNTVFEVKKQSGGTLAAIYSDASGTNQIPQNGIDNISNSVGECVFYIGGGEFYIEVDSKKKFFKTGWSSQSRQAIEALYKSQGYNNVFFFEDGFTYTEANDVGVYSDGTAWTYADSSALPVTIAAGTVPTEPEYEIYKGCGIKSFTELPPAVMVDEGDEIIVTTPFQGGKSGLFLYRVQEGQESDLPNIYLGNNKYISPIGKIYAEHFGAGGSIDSAPAITNYLNYLVDNNGYSGVDGTTYQVKHAESMLDQQFLIGSEVHIRNDNCRGLRIKLSCAAISPIDSSSQMFRFSSGVGINAKVRDVLFEGSNLECMKLTNGVIWESCSTKGSINSTVKSYVNFGHRAEGQGVECIFRSNEMAEFKYYESGYDDKASMIGTAIDMLDDNTDNKVTDNIIIYTDTGVRGQAQNNLVTGNHFYGGNTAVDAQSAIWNIDGNQSDGMTIKVQTERVRIKNNTINNPANSTDVNAIVIAPQVGNAFLNQVVIEDNTFNNRSSGFTMDAVHLDSSNGSINKDKIIKSRITNNFYFGNQVREYVTEAKKDQFISSVNTQTIDFTDKIPSWLAIKNVQVTSSISSSLKSIFINMESFADREVDVSYYDTSGNPVNANVSLYVQVDCYNND